MGSITWGPEVAEVYDKTYRVGWPVNRLNALTLTVKAAGVRAAQVAAVRSAGSA